MTLPGDRRYTALHQWVRSEPDGVVAVGITDYAQEQLGDIVYVELPELGRQVRRGEPCAVVESVKSASDIPAPVSGEIVGRNSAAADAPERVNAEPYNTWLFRVRPAHADELDTLLDADAYARAAGAP